MTDEIKDFSAFPCAAFSPSDDFIHQRGMTIRDWFAGMALQGLINSSQRETFLSGQDLSECAYSIADEMMKARQK